MLDLVRFGANVLEQAVRAARLVRFGAFEVDLRTGELRKDGTRLKLTGQPFQVLTILLEQPGEVVTREELQKRLWPDTFVDVDHNLNTAINKIREVLGDSAESPRYVETLPRRGYRFIAPLDSEGNGSKPVAITSTESPSPRRRRILNASLLLSALTLLAGGGFLAYEGTHAPASPRQRTLTRVTFGDGLEIGPTWSPDGRFIAYSSDRGGKFDVWVQQVTGGDPVQVTKGRGNNWQPDWSPDGKYIVYRSEEGAGGLFVIPALGGAGLERKIASFGYHPRWSPNSSQILFQTTEFTGASRFYVVGRSGDDLRQVLAEFTANHAATSAVWHPDGKRISVWVWDDTDPASFWTAPLDGGAAVKSKISPEILKQVGVVTSGVPISEWADDFKFSWAPAGGAIYFERTFRGVRNIWRMTVDPETLRAIAINRVTTGTGLDTDLSLSPDGKELAFTGQTESIRAWMFPFDATRGRITGPGRAVTSSGTVALRPILSHDGKKVVFCGNRTGKWELREVLLSLDQEFPIASDDSYGVDLPQWSTDGKQLAYVRTNSANGEGQIMLWSDQSHVEEPLTTFSQIERQVWDWSPDGKSLLITQTNNTAGQSPFWTDRSEIWLLPMAARPRAETAERRITASPDYNLDSSHYSPDGRWIVFAADRNQAVGLESTLYAIPSAGGKPWIRITDDKHFASMPRWSPDGKAIYFVSDRDGFFNVWGVRFDPVQGKPAGQPFPVTTLNRSSLMVPKHITGSIELSLTQDRLVLPLAQEAGSIWVLDHVDE